MDISDPHDRHPAELQSWLQDLCDRSTAYTICTYSPTVIHLVEQRWCDAGEPYYDRVILRADRAAMDVSLLAGFDSEWLMHFSLADLYTHGEFDSVLISKGRKS